ncbi:MAG: hypothetical protein KDA78_13685, partial [Planctomycetaceae bacterium]|nr:hypothetical protein [Planctomycetaceae bacterium]
NLVNGFDQAQAYEMFSSRDSWSDLYSSIEVEIVSATEVKLKDVPGADLGVFLTSIATSSPGRIVLRNETGRESFVSPVANVNSGTQSVFLANSIPANGLFDRVQEARLQLLEPRYTAMITVREQLLSFGPDGAPGIAGIDDDNGDGDNNPVTGADDILEVGWEETDDVVRYRGANLVVFFRRDYSERSEQAYAVENLVRQTAGVEFQEIRVFWDGSKPDSKPQIKEGNYLFDPVNGFWYQIRNILVEDGDATTALGNKAAWVPASNNRYAAILLDRTAEANAQYVTFPRNVVEVFDFPAF